MKLSLDEATKLAQTVASDTWGPRDPSALIEKLKEEVEELSQAIQENTGDPLSELEVLKELGDCLFCLVRLADNLDISCDEALKLTIVKIQERIKFGVAK